MFQEIYRFLSKLHLQIKFMSDEDFDKLLTQCDYQQTIYALYFRYRQEIYMTCAEHALENAIEAMKQGKEREEWAKKDSNLSSLKATPEEIWDMACYIVYTYRPNWN